MLDGRNEGRIAVADRDTPRTTHLLQQLEHIVPDTIQLEVVLRTLRGGFDDLGVDLALLWRLAMS